MSAAPRPARTGELSRASEGHASQGRASQGHDAIGDGSAQHQRGLRVGVVGAGRVGAVLAAALARAGHHVVAASGTSAASLARIDRLLPTASVLAPPEVAIEAELLILAVPDDALAGLVQALVRGGAIRAGLVIAHTSGAHGLDLLAPAVAAGARPLAVHPAMTFTGRATDLDRLAEGVSFGVTAPDHLRPLASRLVADLGGTIEWVAEAARPLYHAALAHGANHLVTLVNEAMDRLREAGAVAPERVLAPLLRASLENTLRDCDGALTGPVVRGDAGTVAMHLAALAASAPDSVPAYRALARRTADRAIASGRLRPTDAEPLLGVLAAQPPTLADHDPEFMIDAGLRRSHHDRANLDEVAPAEAVPRGDRG